LTVERVVVVDIIRNTRQSALLECLVFVLRFWNNLTNYLDEIVEKTEKNKARAEKREERR